jgi:two-component system aerobic respiration control sensor histidine kinase ArcB
MSNILTLMGQVKESIPLPMCWLDCQQRYMGINQLALQTMGISTQDCHLGSSTPKDFFSPEVATAIIKNHQQVIQTKQALLMRECNRGKKCFDTKISPLFDDQNNVIGTLCVWVKEVTCTSKEKIFEHLRMIASFLPANVYWLDLNNIILGVNNKTLKAAGVHSCNELIGKTVYDLYPKEMADKISKHHTAAIHSNKTLQHEESILDIRTGKFKHFTTIKSPVYDDTGQIIGTVGMSLDITDRKLLEDALKKSNAVKQEFIANMSHDLRTPITGVMGILQHLIRLSMDAEEKLDSAQPLSTEEQTQLLHQMVDEVEENSTIGLASVDSLLQLCNEILEVVRLESGKAEVPMEAFDLFALTTDVINLLQPTAKDRQLKVEKTLDSNVPQYVLGSRKYLNKILLNLISNALKFTEKGMIKLQVRVAETDGKPSFKKGNPITLKFIVEDTGKGIPQDKFESIFEHFSKLTSSYQGTYKGSGLGLYTVKKYIESMRGTMTVKSELGKGSQFIVTLPFVVEDHTDYVAPLSFKQQLLKRKKKAKAIKVSPQTTRQPDKIHILVVEDSHVAMMMINRLLKDDLHCTTDIAYSGETAVGFAAKNTYDLILMDIGLPKMSGDEATVEIRAFKDSKKANVPIVALTGHAGDPGMREKLLKSGMNAVLSKPASVDALEQVFERFSSKDKSAQPDQQPVASSTEIKLAIPAIDWEGSLHQEVVHGDEHALHELLSLLDGELRATKQVLNEGYQKKDTKTLREELHKIRGSLTYLSLPELTETLKKFHEAVKADPQDPEHLEKTFQAAMEAIKHFQKAYAKGPIDK